MKSGFDLNTCGSHCIVLPPRTPWLRIGCCGNFLKGIGGPGAPHQFSLDRREAVQGAASLVVIH